VTQEEDAGPKPRRYIKFPEWERSRLEAGATNWGRMPNVSKGATKSVIEKVTWGVAALVSSTMGD